MPDLTYVTPGILPNASGKLEDDRKTAMNRDIKHIAAHRENNPYCQHITELKAQQASNNRRPLPNGYTYEVMYTRQTDLGRMSINGISPAQAAQYFMECGPYMEPYPSMHMLAFKEIPDNPGKYCMTKAVRVTPPLEGRERPQGKG